MSVQHLLVLPAPSLPSLLSLPLLLYSTGPSRRAGSPDSADYGRRSTATEHGHSTAAADVAAPYQDRARSPLGRPAAIRRRRLVPCRAVPCRAVPCRAVPRRAVPCPLCRFMCPGAASQSALGCGRFFCCRSIYVAG